MDIPELKAFVEVAQKGSFSKAADVLFITQPAISKRIRALETSLKCVLFERIPKKVLLTNEGQCLLPLARTIIQNVSNAEQAITDIQHEVSGTLNLICSHHIGLHRLPTILKKFTSCYPSVQLQLTFMESELAFKALEHHQADLAFITTSSDNNTDFQHHLRWPDPMKIVCAEDHPLAKVESISLHELATYKAILPSRTTLTFNIVDLLFRQFGEKLNASIPTNYLETIKMMVTAGLGWSALPEIMIDDHLHPLLLKTPTNENVILERELGAISLNNRPLSRACTAFIEMAQSAF